MSALVYYTSSTYWFSYFIFFSALIVTIRSDLEAMLISRYATIFLMPLGWILSFMGWLPLSLGMSLLGSISGYFLLWIIATLFTWRTGKEGMGQGDLELLAFIGAFIGPFGCWITLLLASTIGAICGIIYMRISGQKSNTKIPFGPFLALGAMAFTLFQNYLSNWLSL
jgi:leader peptidase (prepilin peptidase) / N-methyltransferase